MISNKVSKEGLTEKETFKIIPEAAKGELCDYLGKGHSGEESAGEKALRQENASHMQGTAGQGERAESCWKKVPEVMRACWEP